MAKRRPVLHEAVVQEDLLALRDVRAGAVRQQAEDEESAEHDQDHRLDPPFGDQELPPLRAFHHRSSRVKPSADCLGRRASCQIARQFSLSTGKKMLNGAMGEGDR
jgi:hypothetical protein